MVWVLTQMTQEHLVLEAGEEGQFQGKELIFKGEVTDLLSF